MSSRIGPYSAASSTCVRAAVIRYASNSSASSSSRTHAVGMQPILVASDPSADLRNDLAREPFHLFANVEERVHEDQLGARVQDLPQSCSALFRFASDG